MGEGVRKTLLLIKETATEITRKIKNNEKKAKSVSKILIIYPQ